MAIFNCETDLRNHIRKPLKELGHFQPIETGAVASGVADVNFCMDGKEFWLELKIIKGNRMNFRPTQVPWNINRAKAGGNNYILAADKHERIWIWHGRYIRELVDFGIKADVPKTVFPQSDLSSLVQFFRDHTS